MKRLSLLIACILCLYSCKQEIEQDYKEVPVSLEKMDLTEELSLFQLEYACDSFVLATSLSQTHKIVKITDDKVTPFVTSGRGPMEFVYALFKAKTDTLYLLSTDQYGLKGLVTIPMTSIENMDTWAQESLQTDSPLHVSTSFDIDSQRNIVLIGANMLEETNIFTHIDRKTLKRTPLGFWPEDDYEGPSIPKFSVYSNSADIYYNQKLDRYLYVSGQGAYATILKQKEDELEEEYVLFNEKPKYGALPDGLNWGRKSGSRLGIYSFATDSLIYLAPKTHFLENHEYIPDNYKGYPPYFVDWIHVYDWEGNYKYTYVTDKPFVSIFVAEENSKIYLLSNDKETMYSEIYYFDM